MKIRSFRVPFAKVVETDPESHELEFGPDDYMVVRPIFALPAEQLQELGERMQAAATEDEGDTLYADIVALTVLEWRLSDENGVAIPKPATRAEAKKLPAPLTGALYNFLTTYRGDGPNPTTRS